MLIWIRSKKKLLVFFLGILFSVLCGFFLFRSMTWGPWAYNDSSAYVSAARNIASGKGPVILHTTEKIKLITEFPPFYPFFLSLIGGPDGDYIQIIKWVNTILFCLSSFLFFKIMYKVSKSIVITTFSTLFFVTFHPIVEIFTGAMSEPLFLFLLFLDLCLLGQYFGAKNKNRWLLLLAINSAITAITRYAGILFIGVIGLSIFFFTGGNKEKKKINNLVIYCCISFAPIAIWAVSLLKNFGKFAGKNFTLSAEFFGSIINSIITEFNVAKYWIPYFSRFEDLFFGKVLLLVSTLIFATTIIYPFFIAFSKRSNKPTDQNSFVMSLNLGIIGYIGLIAFMHTTSSPQIDIINRTLLPILPLFIIAFGYLLSTVRIGNTRINVYVNLLIVLVALFSLRFNLSVSIPYYRRLSTEGIGYTARSMQQSGIIPQINKIPEDKILISNLSGFVLFHTNRYPIFIENFPHYTYGSKDTYGEFEFREQQAALILLKSDFYNFYGGSAASLFEKITASLNVAYDDNEGTIYYYE